MTIGCSGGGGEGGDNTKMPAALAADSTSGGGGGDSSRRMGSSSTPDVVPACPKGLVFAKQDFLRPDFSIDSFLAKCTANSSLERVRDDLGIYLKVLRSSMIELINQDYADFVNLSTNLVGLDQRIETELRDPLKAYQQQIVKVEHAFQSVLSQLQEKLRLKSDLHQKRILLQNLQHISLTLNKIERLLGNGNDDVTGEVVERVAVDIHHLNHCMTKCPPDSSFYKATRPRLDAVCDRLHASMESQLLEAVRDKNKVSLKRFLRVYSTVDRIKDAENLVRKKIVAPQVEEIVTERSLSSDPQGLKGVLQRCLKIVSNSLSPLLDLAFVGSHVAKDFNFLTNSLFPEIVDKFEENLSHCFSAGNPEKFVVNYRHSMHFLDEFEGLFHYAETLESFRNSCDQYHTFVNRWNLAVYYQIRFQEIALPVEVAMDNVLEGETMPAAGSKLADANDAPLFRLASTSVAAKALKQCWDPSVFLPVLAPKFVKLTFQILSRYSNAVSKTVASVGSSDDYNPLAAMAAAGGGGGQQQAAMKASASSVALTALQQSSERKGHVRSASADAHNHLAVLDETKKAAVDANKGDAALTSKRQQLIRLYLDVTEFSAFVKTAFVGEVMCNLEEGAVYTTEGLDQALEEACHQLESNLVKLDDVIVDEVTRHSMPFLKQVADIPRLYRRTNRELPTKALPYVSSLLQPISEFHGEAVGQCSKTGDWCSAMVSTIAQKYLENVEEVLEAVLKMEESLKRLKRARDVKKSSAIVAPSSGGAEAAAAGSKGVSDDDKIRLQLYVDVSHFVQSLDGFFEQNQRPSSVQKLEDAVTKAAQSCLENTAGAGVSTTIDDDTK